MATAANTAHLAGKAKHPLSLDEGQLRVFLDAILDPDVGCAEFRVLKASLDRSGNLVSHPQYRSTFAGYFDDVEKLIEAARTLKGISGYITVNPLFRDLLARSDNEISKAEHAASDNDVVYLRWWYIDFDAKRLKGISSTDAELAEAVARRDQFLADHPDLAAAAIWGRSGNGAWVLVRLPDYPNVDASRGLVVRATAILSKRYTDTKVEIDTSTTNPGRVGPMVGTVKCKGANRPERPWRLVTIDSPPGRREPIDLAAWVERNAPPEPEKPEPVRPAAGRKATAERGDADEPEVHHDRAAVAEALEGQFEAIAAEWGLELTEKRKGDWRTCRAIDREDKTPSAGLNVKTGVYHDFKGPTDLGFFDLAVKLGAYPDWQAAVNDLGNRVGLGARVNGKARVRATPDGGGRGPRDITAEASDDGPDDDEPEVIDRWPKAQPLAFQGLAGDIVKALEPHTEADPIAILVQFLIAFANMIGRRAHFTVGATRHFLNLYAALVGPTASGRKGSAWDLVSWVLAQFDRDWATRRVQGGLVSGEGLIFHVRDAEYEIRETKGKGGERKKERVMVDAGVEDKRLLVLETEMGRVLKAMSRESNTLSDVMRQGWDRDVLAAMGKNKGCIATGAHISFIGHVTRPDIAKHLTREDSSNGFANRFLWLAVRKSKELPDGGDLFSDGFAREWEPIKHRLEQVVDQAREIDRMRRDVEAGHMWRGVYGELTGGKPGLLGAVLNRAEAQVMRLSCVYALLDQSSYVHPEHLTAALALWQYCEDSARYTFGDAFASPAAEKLLSALQAAPAGLTRTQITVDVFKRNKARAEINSLLSEMLTDGLIYRSKVKPETGRLVELWRAGREGSAHATN
jgi:hypothetical protein